MFPRNSNLNLTLEAWEREPFKVTFGRTKAFRNSVILFCQRLLNANLGEEATGQEGEEGEEEERRRRGG